MSEGITLADALEVFIKKCGCGDEVDRKHLTGLVTKAIEFLLFNGGGNILREWNALVRHGRFTLPRDIETPVKYKFCDLPNAGYGMIYSPYFSYSSTALKIGQEYRDWGTGINIEEKPNRVAYQFAPPRQGIRLLATTRNDLDVGRKIMVSGKQRGMDIAPMHEGYKTAGELLTIYKEDDPNKKYSSFVFDEITSITKDETCDWMLLSGFDRHEKAYHIGKYHPDEISPQYVECQIHGPMNERVIKILGRIDPSKKYIRDEEVLPISSHTILDMLARRARYEEQEDLAQVATLEQLLRFTINQQIAYQSAPGKVMSHHMGGVGFTQL